MDSFKWTLSRLFLFLACLWLTACATMPQPAAENHLIAWQNRAQALAQLKQWNVTGVVAIRTPTDSVTASLHWLQAGDQYTISLWGPLGASAMTLTGQPGHVMLETASGKKFVANSLEQLFVQQTGLNLPVSDLYFWIRGLPVPNLPMQKQFDPYGRLSLLTQQDWQIQFLRYTHANQLDLPNKIFIKNQHINLKLVITTW